MKAAPSLTQCGGGGTSALGPQRGGCGQVRRSCNCSVRDNITRFTEYESKVWAR